jgi:hypothetical protein
MNWQISRELFNHLSNHCSELCKLGTEPTDKIEEELGYLLIQFEDNDLVKPAVQ